LIDNALIRKPPAIITQVDLISEMLNVVLAVVFLNGLLALRVGATHRCEYVSNDANDLRPVRRNAIGEVRTVYQLWPELYFVTNSRIGWGLRIKRRRLPSWRRRL
jgi:hypothetical protein